MAKTNKVSWGRKGYVIINVVGGFGYMIALFGYILLMSLTALLLIPEFSSSSLTTGADISLNGDTSAAASGSVFSSVVAYIIAGVITLLSLAIFILLPYWIGRIGFQLVRKSIKALKFDISLVSIFIAKIAVSLLPFFIMTGLVILADMHYAFMLLVVAGASSFLAIVIFAIQIAIAAVKDRNAVYVW